MLEEARVDMLKKKQKSKSQKDEILNNFRALEAEITRLATKYSSEYLQKYPESDKE